MDFNKGYTILGGDFTFCMTPGIDSTSSAQRSGNVLWKALKHFLKQNQMIEVWRTQNLKCRDYTCHSLVHGTYSIDFFW